MEGAEYFKAVRCIILTIAGVGVLLSAAAFMVPVQASQGGKEHCHYGSALARITRNNSLWDFPVLRALPW